MASYLVTKKQPALLTRLLSLPNFPELDINSAPVSDAHPSKGRSVLCCACILAVKAKDQALLEKIILLPEAAFKQLDVAQVIEVGKPPASYLPVLKYLLALQKQMKGEGEAGELSFDSLDTLPSSIKNACLYRAFQCKADIAQRKMLFDKMVPEGKTYVEVCYQVASHYYLLQTTDQLKLKINLREAIRLMISACNQDSLPKKQHDFLLKVCLKYVNEDKVVGVTAGQNHPHSVAQLVDKCFEACVRNRSYVNLFSDVMLILDHYIYEQLEKKVGALEENVTTLKSENQLIKRESKDLQQKHNQLSQKFDTQKKEISAIKAQNTQMMGLFTTMQAELASLKKSSTENPSIETSPGLFG